MTNWEIRWFFLGLIPDDVNEWKQTIDLKEEAPRTDTYLSFPDCTKNLGVKMSRGSFEIKFCTKSDKLVLTEPDMSGRIQLWSKCKMPLLDDNANTFDFIKGTQYQIYKKRCIRKFDVNLAEKSLLISDDRVKDGVIVELTQLRVYNADWWTLGIDILGFKPIDCLKICNATLFVEYPRIDLVSEYAKSYPEWLSQI